VGFFSTLQVVFTFIITYYNKINIATKSFLNSFSFFLIQLFYTTGTYQTYYHLFIIPFFQNRYWNYYHLFFLLSTLFDYSILLQEVIKNYYHLFLYSLFSIIYFL